MPQDLSQHAELHGELWKFALSVNLSQNSVAIARLPGHGLRAVCAMQQVSLANPHEQQWRLLEHELRAACATQQPSLRRSNSFETDRPLDNATDKSSFPPLDSFSYTHPLSTTYSCTLVSPSGSTYSHTQNTSKGFALVNAGQGPPKQSSQQNFATAVKALEGFGWFLFPDNQVQDREEFEGPGDHDKEDA